MPDTPHPQLRRVARDRSDADAPRPSHPSQVGEETLPAILGLLRSPPRLDSFNAELLSLRIPFANLLSRHAGPQVQIGADEKQNLYMTVARAPKSPEPGILGTLEIHATNKDVAALTERLGDAITLTFSTPEISRDAFGKKSVFLKRLGALDLGAFGSAQERLCGILAACTGALHGAQSAFGCALDTLDGFVRSDLDTRHQEPRAISAERIAFLRMRLSSPQNSSPVHRIALSEAPSGENSSFLLSLKRQNTLWRIKVPEVAAALDASAGTLTVAFPRSKAPSVSFRRLEASDAELCGYALGFMHGYMAARQVPK